MRPVDIWDMVEGFWEWVNRNGSGLGAMAAIITGAIAAVALRQTARDSRERTRPYVLVEYQRIPHVSAALALVVRNTGQSVATDVRVLFNDLGAEADREMSLPNAIKRRYASIFPALSPGQSFSNAVRTGSRNEAGVDRLPDQVTATVTYKYGRKRYTESFVLDCTVYDQEVTTTSSSSPEGRLKEIRDQLKALVRATSGVQDELRSLQPEEGE